MALPLIFSFHFSSAGLVPKPAHQVAQTTRRRDGHGQAEAGGGGRLRRRRPGRPKLGALRRGGQSGGPGHQAGETGPGRGPAPPSTTTWAPSNQTTKRLNAPQPAPQPGPHQAPQIPQWGF